eukprot:CAMPEP_0171540106 /NCGR_PEP_ID=MMETSP0960-20121227/999_1 /TAXON_ID=87120 /ORGANISM="Aurantiochytrium limacinum, Strain ATCCMYA-1381" /LENGTH=143 /DNA_ID=CAMNT_0012087243 /DNA_START=244 /DNA_END=675 /DNA_ORIENTATION=+
MSRRQDQLSSKASRGILKQPNSRAAPQTKGQSARHCSESVPCGAAKKKARAAGILEIVGRISRVTSSDYLPDEEGDARPPCSRKGLLRGGAPPSKASWVTKALQKYRQGEVQRPLESRPNAMPYEEMPRRNRNCAVSTLARQS